MDYEAMKLKEKWSEEYDRSTYKPEVPFELVSPILKKICQDAWLAGFEFAIEKLTETTSPSIPAKEIKELGEEEV